MVLNTPLSYRGRQSCFAYNREVYLILMAPLLLILTLVTTYFCIIASQTPDSSCTITNENDGKCAPCNHCTDQKHNTTLNMRCCPFGCTTPEGLRGKCVDLLSCPRILNMLRGNDSKASLKYFEESRCQGPDEYSVCCDRDPRPDSRHCYLTAHPPARTTGCCGLNARGNTKQYTTEDTYVDANDHPWLARILYQEDKELIALCGGALISGRYVVTTSHCVRGPSVAGKTPVYVGLGEPNCNGEEGANCNDVVIVLIESITPHPEWEPYINPKKNDIAVIRLASFVEFADFIRPVCLPSYDITGMVTAEDDVYFLNHGLPIIAMPDIKETNKDTMQYIDGPAGSLLVEVGGLYELVGMATMTKDSCGNRTFDGSYANAYVHKKWIRNQIAVEEANTDNSRLL